ncbi:MAG: caspase family protein [Bacteroidales bacterium]
MKKVLLIIGIIYTALSVSAQVSESKSGVIQFNISKTETELRKFSDQSRTDIDVTPPVIIMETPVISIDSLVKSDTRTLVLKGKVEDAGGIYAVMVNGVEALVSADGHFMAEIPQAYGRNTIKVVATDVAFNNSMVQFYSERSTKVISDPDSQLKTWPENAKNSYSIEFIQPAVSAVLTASSMYNVKACIKASAPFNKLVIYRGDSFIKGYLGNKVTPSADCAFQLDEPVGLKLGFNDIRIVIYAGDDTVSSSFTIEYSLHAARNFALLIGNEKYDDPGIMDLSEPINDATELYNTLTDEYNFEKENVILLMNPTKADIIGTLHQFRSQINPDDNLLIFYAGHGFWDEGMGVGYWLPSDANKNNPVNWIPNTDLTNYLGAIKSKHTLLIADACFSGGIFKTRSAFSATYAIEMLYQMNSRKAITSGTLTEVPDKSAFLQYLLKNLRENSNEYVSAEELFSKMRTAVINNSENVPQFGTIQNVGDEGGDFIFIRRRK